MTEPRWLKTARAYLGRTGSETARSTLQPSLTLL